MRLVHVQSTGATCVREMNSETCGWRCLKDDHGSLRFLVPVRVESAHLTTPSMNCSQIVEDFPSTQNILTKWNPAPSNADWCGLIDSLKFQTCFEKQQNKDIHFQNFELAKMTNFSKYYMFAQFLRWQHISGVWFGKNPFDSTFGFQ